MGFYLRKGINLGPLRINLSKRGIGASVGGKGLRAGVDAKGKAYTHAGRYGLYHRDSQGGITFGWVLILALGLGLWWAQSQGWLERFEAKPRGHQAKNHPAPAEGAAEETHRE